MLVSWITEENMRKIVRTEDALKFSFVLSSDEVWSTFQKTDTSDLKYFGPNKKFANWVDDVAPDNPDYMNIYKKKSDANVLIASN